MASGVILGAVFLTLIGLCEAAPTGELAQPPETDGCVSETGLAGECTDGKALDNPASVAVSPDGKHVYITSGISNAVAVFSRKKTTGVLTQLSGADGCVGEDGTGGECADGKGLGSASFVTVSPDGNDFYVASRSHAVAVLSRE